MQRIAIVAEGMSHPVDEGFKKATTNLAGAISEVVKETAIFTRNPSCAALEAQALPGNRLLWSGAFARSLRRFGPDAVVYIPAAAATPMSLMRAWCLKRESGGKPIVVISLQVRSYPGVLKPILRVMRPGLVLVLSKASMVKVTDLGYRAGRIPLGVDSDVFKPPAPGAKEALRARYNLPTERIILHVGHVSPGRNLALLKGLAQEGTRVLVVTSTATKKHVAVEAMLRDASVILMDTYIEHIEEIYRAADGYVFPTFSASDAIDLPLSVLEAMATNLPVATTDFGGLKDLFTQGDGLFMCSTEAELVEAAKMLGQEPTATRDKVLGLSWRHAAESVVAAMAAELG